MIVNNNIQVNPKKVNFKGMEQNRSETGNQSFEFYLPSFDKEKYNASVEFALLEKKDNEFIVAPGHAPKEFPLNQDGHIKINPSKIALEGQPFGYRFKLVEKNPAKGASPEVLYHSDCGYRTEHTKETANQAKYVVVLRDRPQVTSKGSTIVHMVVDNHNPGWKEENGEFKKDAEAREKALNTRRSHHNKYGGNVDGVRQDIPRMKEFGYKYVLVTPGGIVGNDTESSHGYWTKNAYGEAKNLKKLVLDLYKNDMGLILDGAFVNESAYSPRIQHVQKWGDKTPYFYNFNMKDHFTIKNLPNVDPHTEEGKEVLSHIKLHIVNGNNKYSFNKDDIQITKQSRDDKKRTYFQLYDDRFLSAEQKKQIDKGELIDETKSNLSTGNDYDVTNDNQSVIIGKTPVSSEQLSAFEKRIKENKDIYSKNKLAYLQSVLRFDNFNVDNRTNGIENWDGNAEVFKKRFGYSMVDEQNFTNQGLSKEDKKKYSQGACQMRDDMVQIGVFRTKMGRNWLVEYTAKELKNAKGVNGYKTILNDSKAKLPESAKDEMPEEVIKNVIDNKYNIPQLKVNSNVRSKLAEELMNLPLESLGFSSDITAVLGSPYISKKAFNKEDIGKSRYEFNASNGHLNIPQEYSQTYCAMDAIYKNETKSVVEFANDVIKKADTEGKFIDKNSQELTDAGKLMVPLVAHDILKFAMVKAIAPNVTIENKNGELVYGKELDDVTLQNIHGKGISAKSPQDEAKQLIDFMKKGLDKISDADKKLLAENIKQRFDGIDANSLKMAYVVVDRTASGINWRADAPKDKGVIDQVRDGLENFGPVMDEVIEMDKAFIKGVRSENPNSYIILEMTDTDSILGNNASGRHKNDMDLEKNYQLETGGVYTNYKFFFSAILEMFSSKPDSGDESYKDQFYNDQSPLKVIRENMIGKNQAWSTNDKGALFTYSTDAVKTSHNFIGNHDKPRALSILALDNRLFHGRKPEAELKGIVEAYAPKMAAQKLTPSYHAIAMADAINKNIGISIDEVIQDESKKGESKSKINLALQDLVQGEFLGKKVNPDRFGVSPIDFAIKDVLAQAENRGLTLKPEEKKQIEDKTFEKMMVPALKKMLIMDKFMTIMPGLNTTYSGDEYGATGYETPFKNIFTTNRCVAHSEWLHDESKKFINEYYQEKKAINNLRNDKELSALSAKGDTVVLNTDNENVLAMFKYDKDSELLCIGHINNINRSSFEVDHNNKSFEIDKVEISPDENRDKKENTVIAGLAGGLALGTIFKNIQDNNRIYGVCKDGGKYVLKGFEKEQDYKTYLQHVKEGKEFKFTEANKIKLLDNVSIFKKINFRGKQAQNPNHIKIQAYLNSKNYLNTQQRNAI